MADMTLESTQLWTVQLAASSGGEVAIRTLEDIANLSIVAQPDLPIGAPPQVTLARRAQPYFDRLDAAYQHVVPEAPDEAGGLPGEIHPI